MSSFYHHFIDKETEVRLSDFSKISELINWQSQVLSPGLWHLFFH